MNALRVNIYKLNRWVYLSGNDVTNRINKRIWDRVSNVSDSFVEYLEVA